MNKTKTFLASAISCFVILFSTINVNAQTSASEDSKATRLGVGIGAGIPTTKGYDLYMIIWE